MGFYFGGRKGSPEARNSGRSGLIVGEFGLVPGEIMVQVGDLNSPTVYVTDSRRIRSCNSSTKLLQYPHTGSAFRLEIL
jgi:hypothetical protein